LENEEAAEWHSTPLSGCLDRIVFPKLDLFTIDQVFGGWKAAQKAHRALSL
jgi:ABC-type sulfate transport system substrate-binding protein